MSGSNFTQNNTNRTPGSSKLTIALIGNPNTGKTSLFNALTGFRRHVANYPGVTVETARGTIRNSERPMELLDLPGTYSLAAMSPDEMVVCNATCGRLEGLPRPDVILAIVDAANLHRNLYLISQLMDLDLPMVLAVNMIDVARGRGIEVDCELLTQRLGMPAVPVIATKPNTVSALLAVLEQVDKENVSKNVVQLPAELDEAVVEFRAVEDREMKCAEALRILIDRDGFAEKQYIERGGSSVLLGNLRQQLATAGIEGPKIEVQARYRWISEILDGVISRPEKPVVTWSDLIDRILTHKVAGAAVLLVVLFLVFQSIFTWTTPLMDSIEWAFERLGVLVGNNIPAGVAQSLLTEGVLGGVGGVLVFLPQILLLFAFIAVLEDCGYMARAAYMNDRLMRMLGLSGRAFIPLLSSFACTVPAIMGTRAIADRRERMVTMLIAPFMSCSARLPIYVLFIAAFIPNQSYLGGWIGLPGLVMMALYLLGVIVAIPVAWILKKTAFAGPQTGFMLELPSYKVPRLRAIWQRLYLAGKDFVIRAGTIILLMNLIVWALGYFPRSETTFAAVEQQAIEHGWDEARQEQELAGAYLRDSYLGRAGRAIEPVVKPIGWDWRVGVAVIASFPAREVVVATLGTIYNLGQQEGEGSGKLVTAIQRAKWEDSGEPVFTLPVALSIMVFFALCAQCSATLVVIGKESGSWIWPVVSFTLMTSMAYLAALGVSSLGRALSSF